MDASTIQKCCCGLSKLRRDVVTDAPGGDRAGGVGVGVLAMLPNRV